MSRWGRHLVVGMISLSVVTAGCTVKVEGEGEPAAQPPTRKFKDSDRVEAADALGELTTWNPCSVVDPDALPADWDVTLDVPAGLEDCVMWVSTDETEAEVQVGYLYRSTHDLEQYEAGPGGLTIVPADNEDGSCTRDIVFADSIALEVLSWPEDPGDVEKVCEISDAVADQVVESVLDGQAEKLTFPDDSIGEIDPCELVTSDIFTAVPGVSADADASRQVHKHSCWWYSKTTENYLNVEFEIGRRPSGDSGEERQDRYTAITRYADDDTNSLCVVDGEHVPFDIETKSGVMEHVSIWVYLEPGQVEAACTAGLAVADKLWPKLPPL